MRHEHTGPFLYVSACVCTCARVVDVTLRGASLTPAGCQASEGRAPGRPREALGTSSPAGVSSVPRQIPRTRMQVSALALPR